MDLSVIKAECIRLMQAEGFAFQRDLSGGHYGEIVERHGVLGVERAEWPALHLSFVRAGDMNALGEPAGGVDVSAQQDTLALALDPASQRALAQRACEATIQRHDAFLRLSRDELEDLVLGEVIAGVTDDMLRDRGITDPERTSRIRAAAGERFAVMRGEAPSDPHWGQLAKAAVAFALERHQAV